MYPTTQSSFSEILKDLVSPEAPNLKPEVAQWMLSLGFSETRRDRMMELAELNNRGEMTDSLREEMDNYRRIGNLVSLLQAKARLSLQQTTQAN
ncbi:MAG: hypothetical protein ACKVP0_25225 [Pirellulaceae bacterium]